MSNRALTGNARKCWLATGVSLAAALILTPLGRVLASWSYSSQEWLNLKERI